MGSATHIIRLDAAVVDTSGWAPGVCAPSSDRNKSTTKGVHNAGDNMGRRLCVVQPTA